MYGWHLFLRWMSIVKISLRTFTIRTTWWKRKSTRAWAEQINRYSLSISFDESNYCSWIHEKPFPKELFSRSVSVKFENINIQCPEKWDKILSVKYGDYMKVPKQELQISNHNFSAYKIGSNSNIWFSSNCEQCIPKS